MEPAPGLTDGSITSPRLVLVPLPADVLDAMLRGELGPATELLGAEPPGWWAQQRRFVFELRRDQLRAQPSQQPWLLRAMLTRSAPPTVVGQIGFHEPPDRAGVVEVGYMVFPEHRRRGYAEEALRTMIDWAAGRPGVTAVRASVSPHNEPSLNLVAKLAFVQTGRQIDDIDGLELVFDLPLPRE